MSPEKDLRVRASELVAGATQIKGLTVRTMRKRTHT